MRRLFLLHRYLGIAIGALMVIWCRRARSLALKLNVACIQIVRSCVVSSVNTDFKCYIPVVP